MDITNTLPGEGSRVCFSQDYLLLIRMSKDTMIAVCKVLGSVNNNRDQQITLHT